MENKKMKKSDIVRYVIGICCIIGGFSGIVSGDVIAGFFTFILGVSFLPIVYKKLNISSEKKIHIIAPIILFLLAALFMPDAEETNTINKDNNLINSVVNNVVENTMNNISNKNVTTEAINEITNSNNEDNTIQQENTTIVPTSSSKSNTSTNSDSMSSSSSSNASDGSNNSSSASSSNINQSKTYILNTNSKKFHYSGCRSVAKMKEENKDLFTGSRDSIISEGYSPCGICKP